MTLLSAFGATIVYVFAFYACHFKRVKRKREKDTNDRKQNKMILTRLSRLCFFITLTITYGLSIRNVPNNYSLDIPPGKNGKLKTLDFAVVSEVLEAIISNIDGIKRIDRIHSIDKPVIKTIPKTEVSTRADKPSSDHFNSTRKDVFGINKPTYTTASIETTPLKIRRLLSKGSTLKAEPKHLTSSISTTMTSLEQSSTSTSTISSTSTTNAPTTKKSTTPTTTTPAPQNNNRRGILDSRMQFCLELKRSGKPIPRQCGGMLDIWN